MLSLRYRKLTQHTHTKCLLELIMTFSVFAFFKHVSKHLFESVLTHNLYPHSWSIQHNRDGPTRRPAQLCLAFRTVVRQA
jgi:hypothetical protein